MASFNDIIYKNIETSNNDIEQIVARYPWWSAARLRLYRSKGDKTKPATQLIAMLHPAGAIARGEIDIATLTALSHDELIGGALRIAVLAVALHIKPTVFGIHHTVLIIHTERIIGRISHGLHLRKDEFIPAPRYAKYHRLVLGGVLHTDVK